MADNGMVQSVTGLDLRVGDVLVDRARYVVEIVRPGPEHVEVWTLGGTRHVFGLDEVVRVVRRVVR